MRRWPAVSQRSAFRDDHDQQRARATLRAASRVVPLAGARMPALASATVNRQDRGIGSILLVSMRAEPDVRA